MELQKNYEICKKILRYSRPSLYRTCRGKKKKNAIHLKAESIKKLSKMVTDKKYFVFVTVSKALV